MAYEVRFVDGDEEGVIVSMFSGLTLAYSRRDAAEKAVRHFQRERPRATFCIVEVQS